MVNIYKKIITQVDEAAAALLALGIQRGDRVGVWGPNVPEWIVMQYATARIGAIMVNINPSYRPLELEFALNKVSEQIYLYSYLHIPEVIGVLCITD